MKKPYKYRGFQRFHTRNIPGRYLAYTAPCYMQPCREEGLHVILMSTFSSNTTIFCVGSFARRTLSSKQYLLSLQ